MQIGVFSVSDITRDPVTGRMPTEGERIKAAVAIARKVEEIGTTTRPSTLPPPPPCWATLLPRQRESFSPPQPR